MHQLIVPVAVATVLITTPAMAELAESSRAERSNYDSAFRDYRPFKDPSLRPWRDINDLAARIGGHGGALASGAAKRPPASAEKTPAGAATGTPPAHPGHP